METQRPVRPRLPNPHLLCSLWIGTAWIYYFHPPFQSNYHHISLIILLIVGPFNAILEYISHKVPIRLVAYPPSLVVFKLVFGPSKNVEEKEQEAELSQERGLLSVIFRSKRLGFVTIYFRFPSNEIWLQSSFWSLFSFLNLLSSSGWLSQGPIMKELVFILQILMVALVILDFVDMLVHFCSVQHTGES